MFQLYSAECFRWQIHSKELHENIYSIIYYLSFIYSKEAVSVLYELTEFTRVMSFLVFLLWVDPAHSLMISTLRFTFTHGIKCPRITFFYPLRIKLIISVGERQCLALKNGKRYIYAKMKMHEIIIYVNLTSWCSYVKIPCNLVIDLLLYWKS